MKNWERELRIQGPRGRLVDRVMPELREGLFKKVLYIGANRKRFQLYGMFPAEGLYVLEVFPEYCAQLRADRRRPVAGVIQGDVRLIDRNPEIARLAPFDLVVWWHGPEHVAWSEAVDLLAPGGRLEPLWSRAILLGCPWGIYRQGAVDGNPDQEHRWFCLPGDFEEMAYQVATVGGRDQAGGHIMAWKRNP